MVTRYSDWLFHEVKQRRQKGDQLLDLEDDVANARFGGIGRMGYDMTIISKPRIAGKGVPGCTA